MLSDFTVRQTKAAAKPYALADGDGDGLFLYVSPNGTMGLWRNYLISPAINRPAHIVPRYALCRHIESGQQAGFLRAASSVRGHSCNTCAFVRHRRDGTDFLFVNGSVFLLMPPSP